MNFLIIDTADVVVKARGSNKSPFISAETQISSLAASLGVDEDVFGGIGNKRLAKFQGQKTISSTLQNAFFDPEMLAMTQGVEVLKDKGALVYEKEEGLLVQNGSVSLAGTPEGEVQIRNQNGVIQEVESSEGSITVPEDLASDGDRVQAWYKKEVTGQSIELKSDKYAELHEYEAHTIGYDPNTNKVLVDVYIQLDAVLPNGEIDLSFENGTAQTPEVTFDAINAPNTNDIGRILIIPREDDEQQVYPTP